MTSKTIISLIIAMAFITGSITTGTFANAVTTPDITNPLQKIWHAINQLQDEINGLTHSHASESTILWTAGGAMFTGGATYMGETICCSNLTDVEHVIPTDGTISNLFINLNFAPGTGNDFTITIVKNGTETDLKCKISNLDNFCKDTSNTVNVKAGDLIAAKIDPSGPNTSHEYTFKLGMLFTTK